MHKHNKTRTKDKVVVFLTLSSGLVRPHEPSAGVFVVIVPKTVTFDCRVVLGPVAPTE